MEITDVKQYVLSIESIHGIHDYDIKKGGFFDIKNYENCIPRTTRKVKIIEILRVEVKDEGTDIELLVEDVKPLVTLLGDPDEVWESQKLTAISQSTQLPPTVTIPLTSPIFRIGDYQFWENGETSEIWKRKFDDVLGNHGEWEKTTVIANDFR